MSVCAVNWATGHHWATGHRPLLLRVISHCVISRRPQRVVVAARQLAPKLAHSPQPLLSATRALRHALEPLSSTPRLD